MSEPMFWASVFAGSIAAIAWGVRTVNRIGLRDEVESIMKDGGNRLTGPYAVTRARALIACRGHLLDPRTRDALSVWLAEHDKAGEP